MRLRIEVRFSGIITIVGETLSRACETITNVCETVTNACETAF